MGSPKTLKRRRSRKAGKAQRARAEQWRRDHPRDAQFFADVNRVAANYFSKERLESLFDADSVLMGHLKRR